MPISVFNPQPSKVFTKANIAEFFTRFSPGLRNMGNKARGYCTTCAEPHSVFYSKYGIDICVSCATEVGCLPDDSHYDGEY